MEYYWLIPSTGKDVGSASMQCERFKNYDWTSPNSFKNLPNLKEPDFTPDFGTLELSYKAKVTDIIFAIGMVNTVGFFLNEKTKQILEQFNLPKHFYYPAKILHRDKLFENYYWIHFAEDNTNLIDFEKSTFDVKKSFGWQEWIDIDKNNFQFNSQIDFQNFYKNRKDSMEDIIPSKLQLLESINNLFIQSYLCNDIIIDELIYKKLSVNKITGSAYSTLINQS